MYVTGKAHAELWMCWQICFHCSPIECEPAFGDGLVNGPGVLGVPVEELRQAVLMLPPGRDSVSAWLAEGEFVQDYLGCHSPESSGGRSRSTNPALSH